MAPPIMPRMYIYGVFVFFSFRFRVFKVQISIAIQISTLSYDQVYIDILIVIAKMVFQDAAGLRRK